jgi:hypothetical protein
MTTLKTTRMTTVSALWVKFGSCFGLLHIAGQAQYRYIVDENKIYVQLLWNLPEKLTKCSLFYLFLKLIQINFICSDNVYKLKIPETLFIPMLKQMEIKLLAY